jgi:hypothetical protein
MNEMKLPAILQKNMTVIEFCILRVCYQLMTQNKGLAFSAWSQNID